PRPGLGFYLQRSAHPELGRSLRDRLDGNKVWVKLRLLPLRPRLLSGCSGRFPASGNPGKATCLAPCRGFDLRAPNPNNQAVMDIYEEIDKLRQQGRRGTVATIVNVRGSIPSFKTAKMLVRDDGSIAGTIGGGCVEAEVWQAAREVMQSERPRTLTFN